MHEIKQFFKITGKGKRFLVLLLLRCPFDIMMTVLRALFLQYSFNAIASKDQKELALVCAAAMLANFVLLMYNRTIWAIFSAFVIELIAIVRRKLFAHVSSLKLTTIEEKTSGEWFTRLNSDVQSATTFFSGPLNLVHAVVSLINLSVSFFILFFSNITISYIVLFFLIPHMIIGIFYVSRPMVLLSEKAKKAIAENSTDMNALISSAEIIRLYDAKDFMLNRYEESSKNILKANMKMHIRSGIGRMTLLLLGMSGYLVILTLGAGWISAGQMTFGELTSSFEFRGGVIAGSMMFVNSLTTMKISQVGIKRVNETLDM